MGQGGLLDGLEEFEALPLKRQKRTFESNLLKISVGLGFIFGDMLHLFLNVSFVGCGVRL